MKYLIFTIFLFFQDRANGLFNAPGETVVEPTVINLVSWLRLFIEMTGAIIIAIGVFLSIYQFFRALFSDKNEGYTQIRLLLARYLALALEFQLGADILSTAIAPSWDQIGKLGAIAVIRTALNYFLSREMQQERKLDSVKKDNEQTDEKYLKDDGYYAGVDKHCRMLVL
ncbi:hypothetical protein BH10ACI1_BH10ACI1_34730 [soil metagenome]